MTDYEEAGSVTPEQYNKIEAIASSLRSLAAEKDAEIEKLKEVLTNLRLMCERDSAIMAGKVVLLVDAALKGSSQ